MLRASVSCTGVSGLKTGCSRSYVCSATSIFSRCSPLLLFLPLSISLQHSTTFSRFLFLSVGLGSFSLHTPAKRKTVHNGADEMVSPSLFLPSFLFLFTCSLVRYHFPRDHRILRLSQILNLVIR